MEKNSQQFFDVEDYLSQIKRFAEKYLKGWLSWLIILIFIGVWSAQGFYTINPAEVGLVKLFGRHVKTVGPGLHYHIPAPIQEVIPVDVKSIRKIEVGYTTISPPPNPKYRVNKEEALMLTGDGNIVHIEFAVQYKVKEPEKYAFNLIAPREIIKEMAEAIMREEIAKRNLADIITTDRGEIALDVYNDLQELLDTYQTGILTENVKLQDANPPEPVSEAFDDVNSAWEDKETYINQANAYANKVIPDAQGRAAQITNTAEAYQKEKIAASQGDVAKFKKVLAKYNAGSKDITRTRLYIEAIEKILPEAEKILLTEDTKDSGILKFLDLNKLSSNGGENK